MLNILVILTMKGILMICNQLFYIITDKGSMITLLYV